MTAWDGIQDALAGPVILRHRVAAAFLELRSKEIAAFEMLVAALEDVVTLGDVQCGVRRCHSEADSQCRPFRFDFPLCARHTAEVLNEMTRAQDTVLSELKAWERARADARDQASVVYYLQRRDGLIKIGFSSRLSSRMKTLEAQHGPLVLLASHKGSRAAERAQHQRFAPHRVVGEWFQPASELIAHVEHIKARRVQREVA